MMMSREQKMKFSFSFTGARSNAPISFISFVILERIHTQEDTDDDEHQQHHKGPCCYFIYIFFTDDGFLHFIP